MEFRSRSGLTAIVATAYGLPLGCFFSFDDRQPYEGLVIVHSLVFLADAFPHGLMVFVDYRTAPLLPGADPSALSTKNLLTVKKAGRATPLRYQLRYDCNAGITAYLCVVHVLFGQIIQASKYPVRAGANPILPY